MADATALLEENPPQNLEQGQRESREPGTPIRLHGVKWRDYVDLCDLIGERHVRTSFIDGDVEIMTLSFEHEYWNRRPDRVPSMFSFRLPASR